jgi:UDP-glucose 4-epimerase
MGDYFKVPIDARSLDYEIYFDKGQNQNVSPKSFTSSNTKQLTPEEVASLLLSLPEFNSYLAERKN